MKPSRMLIAAELVVVPGALGCGNDSNLVLPQCEACDLLDQLVAFSGTYSFEDNQADTCSNTCD